MKLVHFKLNTELELEMRRQMNQVVCDHLMQQVGIDLQSQVFASIAGQIVQSLYQRFEHWDQLK